MSFSSFKKVNVEIKKEKNFFHSDIKHTYIHNIDTQ